MADRLSGPEIERRLALVDDLLGQLEQVPGATAAAGLAAARALAEVYGEALARLMDQIAGLLPVRAAALDDELIGHLLVLHDIHPEPVPDRIIRALDRMRPSLHGGDVRLAGISDGIAQIELTGPGCASSASTLELAVREAVLAVAPELHGVRLVRPEIPARAPALIPLGQVRTRPEARRARPAPAVGGPA
jgi:Fe-S cluster biogenesis protein NfuA